MSRIWVVWWIDQVEGGRGRWKFRISVSAITEIADTTNRIKCTAGLMASRARSMLCLCLEAVW